MNTIRELLSYKGVFVVNQHEAGKLKSAQKASELAPLKDELDGFLTVEDQELADNFTLTQKRTSKHKKVTVKKTANVGPTWSIW
jgi:hypothetical protein